MTDSQFVYYFAHLCQINVQDDFSVDGVTIQITDEDKAEFIATFDLYSKNTGTRYGKFKAKFFDVNNTSIPEVTDYLSEGDEPSTQTKDDLKTVLNAFKGNNYSYDTLVNSKGMAKVFYNPSYYFLQVYGDPNTNEGYLKDGDHIYSFGVQYETDTSGQIIYDSNNDMIVKKFVVNNKGTDYADDIHNMKLPGIGKVYSDENSLNYMSEFSIDLYDTDKYDIGTYGGITYWNLNDYTLSQKLFDYVYSGTKSLLPLGVGVKVSNKADSKKLSLILASTMSDGSQSGYAALTYYDIGTTSNPIIEKQIENYLSNK